MTYKSKKEYENGKYTNVKKLHEKKKKKKKSFY